jgi:hypothetical protein
MMSAKPQVIAFYLPQFHPISENDEWWGKGFTEWTNVAKAKPLFPGHYQPRIPADLGFYDLRLPEVREEQVKLAREAGIDAFCYWHYWFGNGKQLLERPLQEVVKSGKPDFPFCLGWANCDWYRKDWNPKVSRLSTELLIKQTYPGQQDIKDHFYTMLDTFNDRRYYRMPNGKLLFVILLPSDIPDIGIFMNTWQELAKENNLPEFFFVGYAARIQTMHGKNMKNCNAVALSALGLSSLYKYTLVSRIKRRILGILRIPLNKINYRTAVKEWEEVDEYKKDLIYPVIFPNWDHSARMGGGGTILHDSTPALFKRHVKNIFDTIKNKSTENQIVFIKSWNEWAEGNYLEPDLRFGKGYIAALREALNEFLNSN